MLSDDVARWVRARYADYKAGKVSEDDMCGEMVTIHSGLAESEVQQLAKEFFDENFVKQIFPEMRDLVRQLQSSGLRCLGRFLYQRVGDSGSHEAFWDRRQERF